MACYISSSNNRYYVAREATYGAVPAIAATSRIPALQLSAKQQLQHVQRRDKTGGRTFHGHPAGLRKTTSFTLRTLLTAWANQGVEPRYGPIFHAALGSQAAIAAGGIVAGAADASTIQFASAHGMARGQATVWNHELRFVTEVVNAQTVKVNAPFSSVPNAGSTVTPTATYSPAEDLPSISLFDYWGPATAVQRILYGAAVDRMRIKVNADYHEFEFTGPAMSMTDNVAFASGEGALASFPAEPAIVNSSQTIIPGHLGQAWLGTTATKFLTITAADVSIENNLDVRAREFGLDNPRCIVAGERDVSLSFSLYSKDDTATNALYQAAKQGSTVPIMFQLGKQAGQLFGFYLKGVKVELPEFEDSNRRLEWNFVRCRAEGVANDEIAIAFG